MVLLAILVPALILGLGFLMGAIFGPAFPTRWWLLRIGLVPFLFWLLVAWFLSAAPELPVDYDPAVHGNPGREDFLAILLFGFAAPVLYLIIAVPVTLGYVLIRRRRMDETSGEDGPG